jgi:16S rRNA processing protein RimM
MHPGVTSSADARVAVGRGDGAGTDVTGGADSLTKGEPPAVVVMGRVAAPHGVRGVIKVQPLCADPSTLLRFEHWWLRRRDADPWSPHRVVASRLQSGMVAAELEGVTTREAAAALRGATIGVPRELLPALADDEYYRADLVGMAVVNRSGRALGSVAEFLDSGAHPILRVAREDGGERLIPWVSHYIDRVDVAARRVDVDWAEDF